MSPNVSILPKRDAEAAARAATAQTRPPTDVLALRLFCDGSYHRGSLIRRIHPTAALAVVANIWPPGATTNERMSKACFVPCNDPDDNNNTVEAFALAEAVHVAIDQVAKMEEQFGLHPSDGIDIVFYSDSQFVLRYLRNGSRPFWLSKRFRHILDIIELKTRELERWGENVSVRFRWCPGECVEPHETADWLSKRVRINGGSGTESQAQHLFYRIPHDAIQEALQATHIPATRGEADTSVQDNNDSHGLIRAAVFLLPRPYRRIMLAIIYLQEVFAAREARGQNQNQNQNQVPDSEDQVSRSTVQGHEQHGGGSDENDEAQFYDAREQGGEPGDRREDGNVDDERAIAGGGEALPNRVRALWNWVRGRPRL